MQPLVFEMADSPDVILNRLAKVLQSEPNAYSIPPTPLVYDRLMGNIDDSTFQARLYSSQISAGTVIANGEVSPNSGDGSLLVVRFSGGAKISRFFSYALGIIGVVLFIISAFFVAVPGIFIGFCIFALFGYNFGMARFERYSICNILTNNLKTGGG